MKKIDLEQRYIDEILKILKVFLPREEIAFYIFGSRARGTAKKYSDIDIAIDCNGGKLEDLLKIKIEKTFEETTIPYKVDIIDLNDISDSFKNHIKEDLIRIH